MFKVKITEKYTEMNGTGEEKLAGLACYIQALRNSGIPDFFIKGAVEIAFEDNKRSKQKNRKNFDNDDMKIQEFDLNNMSKEEAKEFFEKEILNKLFD